MLIVFDRFAIYPARREATLGDKIIKLTALEFNVLYFWVGITVTGSIDQIARQCQFSQVISY